MTWRLALDARFTRRKRYHLAIDPEGEVRWKSQRAGEVLAWLAHNDIVDYTIITDQSGEYRATVLQVIEKRTE